MSADTEKPKDARIKSENILRTKSKVNMSNIINAIIQLVENPKFELRKYSESHNRTNNMDQALKEYIKDIFAGTVNESDENIRN